LHDDVEFTQSRIRALSGMKGFERSLGVVASPAMREPIALIGED